MQYQHIADSGLGLVLYDIWYCVLLICVVRRGKDLSKRSKFVLTFAGNRSEGARFLLCNGFLGGLSSTELKRFLRFQQHKCVDWWDWQHSLLRCWATLYGSSFTCIYV